MQTQAAELTSEKLSSPLRATSLQSPRILLAEDDFEMRRLLAWTLTRAGYQVQECPDGAMLMKRLSFSDHYRPVAQFDLVVSDVRMPGMTGLEVLKMATQQGTCPPMILISAFFNRETEALAQELGAVALLPKPFDMEELMHQVRQLLPLDHAAAPPIFDDAEDGEDLPFPLEITFRHHSGTEPVKRFIRKLARKLARCQGRVTRCRVVIDSLHPGERTRPAYQVHLFLTTSGRPVVVQHDAASGSDDENLYLALNHAFAAAERSLKQKRRGSWRRS